MRLATRPSRLGMLATIIVACSSSPRDRLAEPVAPAPAPAVVEAEQTNLHARVAANRDAVTLPAPPKASVPLILVDRGRILGDPELSLGAVVLGISEASTQRLNESSEFRTLAAIARRETFQPWWWFRSPDTSFELVAVVNRLDRMDIRPKTCGETRLLYRLVHTPEDGSPRPLPAALNVLFAQRGTEDGCQATARSWIVDSPTELTQNGGPLSEQALGKANLVAIESNVRFGSRHTFHIFRPHTNQRTGERVWRRASLEVDPFGMQKSRSPLKTILDPDKRQDIFKGTVVFGKGASYRKWDSLGDSDLLFYFKRQLPDDGDYSPFADKQAFLERLGSLSCGGCHAARSIDGFHATLGPSPHLQDEVEWRRDYVRAIAEGKEPNRTRLSVFGEPR